MLRVNIHEFRICFKRTRHLRDTLNRELVYRHYGFNDTKLVAQIEKCMPVIDKLENECGIYISQILLAPEESLFDKWSNYIDKL